MVVPLVAPARPPVQAAPAAVLHVTAMVRLLSLSRPATVRTRDVMAALVGLVTPARAPSRAALLIVSDVSNASPKSKMPNAINMKAGTMSANSTRDCPRPRWRLRPAVAAGGHRGLAR